MAADAETVLAFMGQLRLVEGRRAGRPLKLEGWQQDFIRELLAKDEDGNRVRREALLGIARKNGKSTLVAALAIALMVCDEEPGGQVIVAASKRDQARLLFSIAQRMVRSSTLNGAHLSDFLEVRRDSIYMAETDTVLRIISSDAQKEHGLNPSVAIVDELHAIKDAELFYALSTAQGARDNPLLIGITTAGQRPTGIAHDLYKSGKAQQEGKQRPDPSFLFRWYEADADLDPYDDEQRAVMLEQGNPGLGSIVSRDFLERQWRAVLDGKLPQYVFERLHLNRWTYAAERWLPYAEWKACGEPVDVPEDAEVVVGLDAALSRDTFGVGLAYRDDEGQVHVKGWAFVPGEDGRRYIDPTEVETHVLGLAARFRVRKLVYDPAYMQLLAIRLEDRGMELEPVPQTDSNMVRVAETFQRLVLDGLLRHGGDPLLDTQLGAVGTKLTDRGVRITKSKSGGHIDAVVAVAMAVDGLLNGEDGRGDDFAFFVDMDDTSGWEADDDG